MFAPICVACRREMRCRQNDFLFADYDAVAVWAGDQYECENCQASVIVGVARTPVAVWHEHDFISCQARSGFELTREIDAQKGGDL